MRHWLERALVLCTLVLWWFLYDFAKGTEEYSVLVEHSFDLGHTWQSRGQIQLPLKQGTFEEVKSIERNFTKTEMDSLMQLVLDNKRYFIRASKSPTSEFHEPVWLVTSYKACRLLEWSFREVVYVYLDVSFELIGLGADYLLHGVCNNHTSDWYSRKEALGRLVASWYVKTPHFPRVGLGKRESIEETFVQEENRSFIERNFWFIAVIGGLLLLNILVGWIRFRMLQSPSTSANSHLKSE